MNLVTGYIVIGLIASAIYWIFNVHNRSEEFAQDSRYGFYSLLVYSCLLIPLSLGIGLFWPLFLILLIMSTILKRK